MDNQKARRFVDLTLAKRGLKADLMDIEEELTKLEESLLDEMSEDGMPEFRQEVVDDSGATRRYSVYVSRRTTVAPAEGFKRSQVCDVLRELGLEDMITFNSNTLAAHFREAEETEQPIEPELAAVVNVGKLIKLGVRRA